MGLIVFKEGYHDCDPEPEVEAQREERLPIEKVPGQPCYTLVLCRTIEAVDEKARGERILSPNIYNLTSQNTDKLFLAEVIRNGRGQVVKGHAEEFVCKPGEIAMFLENRVSYRKQTLGQRVYLVRNSSIAGILDPETFAVKPTNHYVLVRPNEERAIAVESREGLAGADGERRMIWLNTDQAATDDEQEGKLRRPGLIASYGEVVDVGPGRWEDGTFLEPQCAPGDLIFFDASHSTLPCTIRGKPHTLVPCDQIAENYGQPST